MLRGDSLKCYSLALLIMRSIFWTIMFIACIRGVNSNYQWMKDNNDLYNEHDNKELPKSYFIVADVSRGIGSYAESVTRSAYYVFGTCYF